MTTGWSLSFSFEMFVRLRQVDVVAAAHEQRHQHEDDEQHQHDVDERRHVDVVAHVIEVGFLVRKAASDGAGAQREPVTS